MILIGEKLNSSIPSTLAAMDGRNTEKLISLIKAQEECGAGYLDINTAVCAGDEAENLRFMIKLVLENSSCGIMLDSPSADVIKAVADEVCDRKLIINSVTLTERIDELLPLIKEKNAGVVALPMGDEGIPESAEERLENAVKLVEIFDNAGISRDKVYLDAIIQSVAIDSLGAKVAIDTVKLIREKINGVHITCGASNISFGLPKRVNIDCAFLTAAIFCGLDSAILNVASEAVRRAVQSALVISGQDDYCMDYISFIRSLEE